MNKLSLIDSLIQAQDKIRYNMIQKMKQFLIDGESFTPLQIEAMMLILEHTEIKMSDLAKILNLKTSGATQLINTLESQNKIVRKSSPKDKRIVFVSLTPQTVQMMKKMKIVHRKALADMFNTLNQDELQTLLQITQKITLAL